MITLRIAEERGHTKTAWLDSRHSFSFADYHDPNHVHYRSLRVINQDIIQPGKGFAMHPHHDMEILTYILRGSLEHRDSLGNHGLITAGEMQRMTAGTGILHSEVNASNTDPVELLQIWLFPAQKQLFPSYQQQSFIHSTDKLQKMVSATGDQQTLTIHQDVNVYRGWLLTGQTLNHDIVKERYLWLQQISGQLEVEGHLIKPGDGMALQERTKLSIVALEEAEFLLFDLA